MRLDRLDRLALGALAYTLLGSIWIFGLWDTDLLYGRQVLGWTCVGLFAAANLAVGLALGSWIVLAFPSLLILLAALAGYPEAPYESPPLWFWQGLLSPLLLVLLALGVAIRRRRDRSRT
jgi:hypothetical protein